jgi:two-component system response regulator HydG
MWDPRESVIEEAPDSKVRIAVIDDDPDLRVLLETVLGQEGYRVDSYRSPSDILPLLEGAERHPFVRSEDHPFPDLVISDILMPDIDGLKFLEKFRQLAGDDIPLIFITAHGSMETAIQAMRHGAFDYMLKPIKLPDLKLAVERALRFQTLKRENSVLRQQIADSWSHEGIVGKSPKIRQIFDIIRRIAKTDANVLVHGESGTGKELVARAIHASSGRTANAFVAINCSAIPEALLESELFGHAKGAFTGAVARKKGLFEMASGGTLFLDEIGDMNVTLQAKLLRVLQDRRIRPVGDNQDYVIDVRIVAATHKNLKQAIKNGEFREDLYYRLNVIPVEIPALRERAEDIPLLAEYFLKKFTAAHNLKVKGFTKAALNKLIEQPWPGNIRELENTVERAVILCEAEYIDTKLIRDSEGQEMPRRSFEENFHESLTLDEIEKRYIQFILKQTNGAKETAARILGIDRKTLYRKEKDFNLQQAADSGSSVA